MIHETAIVDAGAELGDNVSVGPFTTIEANVRIGDGCVIGPRVSVLPFTTLGADCTVHAGAVLGDVPQDLKFEACESQAVVGRGCIIREGVTIHRGLAPGSVTEIGEECFLMGFSHYAHNVRLGRHVIVANGTLLAGHVEVGDRAFISGNCLMHQFVRVGRVAMLGGGCAVSKDVPPFCTVRPVSFNCVVGLNVVGMRRAGLSPEERLDVKRAVGFLYRSGLNVRQAVAKIRSCCNGASAMQLCEFIEASERGLCAMTAEPQGAA